MKKCKKNKIKGFRKKSVWPSIILFLMSIMLCLLSGVVFVAIFEAYIISSKMSDLMENAEHLGQLIEGRMREEDILEAVGYVDGYLQKENDICVTDAEHNVLLHFGETKLPDFADEVEIEMIDKYTVVPGFGLEIGGLDQYADDSKFGLKVDFTVDSGIMLPFGELWERTMKAPPGRGPGQRERWFQEVIFSVDYWTQIPVRADGYHVYYKDSVTLVREDIVYMLVIGGFALIVLMMPVLFLFINVLSSIAMQRRMINVLYLDTATGGKNWLYFTQRCRRIFRFFWNVRNTYAMVNLHMDRYQDYCTCYGNKAGEGLLENINGFLQAKVTRGETFARFARADFGLLLRCDSEEACERRLKKMMAELTGIKKERKLSYHVGICMIEPIADRKDYGLRQRKMIDVEQIYHYANAARETLHGTEGRFIQVFDRQILEGQLWKHKVEDSMEAALMNKEFHIYLQPKYSPVSEKIVGAEALVRWISPTEGLIVPDRFIPIFEENGFITKLDDYMISGVAKLQSEWKIQGKKPITISVNVSRANFTKEDLARHICDLVDNYGADRSGIELEVTESTFFGDKEMLQKIIKELKMYGFHISMDDFGAGYSSLNSLKDLPIDVLKLDVDFFKGEDVEKRGEIVVRETIQLAKNLNMKIVAEGIERKEQVDFLAEQGCDMIQGYYYAEPMPLDEFDERFERDS